MLFVSLNTKAQTSVKYGENYIVFEGEDTNTPLGSNWTVRKPGDSEYLKYLTNVGISPAPMNDTYLEFTGAWLGAGSELEYKFICPKTGTYELAMRMHSPLRTGELGDARNDFFVKMDGNYTSGSTKHTETDLRTFHKMFGRGANKWGTCINLELNGNNGAFYNLIKGEEYTFTLKGRSTAAVIDYITFYDTSYLTYNINNQGPDLALQLPLEIRPYSTPTAISLNPSPAAIRLGTTSQLATVMTPTNANPSVTWTSSNDQIISVDQYGNITSKGTVGEKATITAISKINTSLLATSEVTIVAWYSNPVTAISVTPNQTVIVENSASSFTATVSPANADNKAVTWSSSDNTIAKVDQNGNVTAVKKGIVTIRATSQDNATIFAESQVEIVQFFAQVVSFDNDSKYKNGTYYNTGNMQVVINYHAGSLETIKTPIKVFLRELKSTWTVVKDVVVELSETVGTTSGSVTATIPLDGLTPTADLASGNFYYLYVINESTNNLKVSKGINPIILLNKSLSVDDKQFNEAIKLYPNPTTNGEIRVANLDAGKYELSVYSMLGAELKHKKITISANENPLLNANELGVGTYILVLKNEQQLYKSIFIVQ